MFEGIKNSMGDHKGESDKTAWKLCKRTDGNGYAVAQLRIPKEAKRVAARGSNKYRANKVEVIQIFGADLSTSFMDKEYHGFGKEMIHDEVEELEIDYSTTFDVACSVFADNSAKYRVGEVVFADEFDSNPSVECSNGIHFLFTISELEEYLVNNMVISKERDRMFKKKSKKKIGKTYIKKTLGSSRKNQYDIGPDNIYKKFKSEKNLYKC